MDLFRTKGSFAVVLLLMSWGCSGQPSTVSWQCDEKASEPLGCKQVSGDVALKPARTDISTVQEKSSSVQGENIPLEENKQSWRKQLPALSEQSGEYSHQAAIQGQHIDVQPRVAQEVDVAGVSELEQSSIQQKRMMERSSVIQKILVPTAGIASERPEKSLAVTDVTQVSEKMYTVQLGAFPIEQDMKRFIVEKSLVRLNGVLEGRTQKNDVQWYVVTWGRFVSVQQAETAWQQQQESFPSVKHWVRAANSLRKVKEITDL